MATLWIMRGLPASGKTEWARAQVDARDVGEVVRLSRDDLRRMALPAEYREPVAVAETLITMMAHAALRVLLLGGHDVICDDMNLADEAVHALVGIARWADAAVEIVDLRGVPVEDCVRRDAARPAREHVGAAVIRELHARYLAPGDHPRTRDI